MQGSPNPVQELGCYPKAERFHLVSFSVAKNTQCRNLSNLQVVHLHAEGVLDLGNKFVVPFVFAVCPPSSLLLRKSLASTFALRKQPNSLKHRRKEGAT